MSESKLKIKTFILGSMNTNCYAFNYHDTFYIIDPGENPVKVIKHLQEQKPQAITVLITHCHFDHIAGIEKIVNSVPQAQVYVPEIEIEWLTQSKLNLATLDKKEITIKCDAIPLPQAINQIEVISVPGHSPGSVAFYLPDEGVIFSGDSLFRNTIGTCEIPNSNQRTLLKSIRENLFILPEATKVYPGHGFRTTIKNEIENNPYFNKE